MAKNYIESSFALNDLTDEEIAWWKEESERKIPEGMCAEDMSNPVSIDWELKDRTVWFHNQDSMDVESAAIVIQRFLMEFRREDTVGFTYAWTCSFGGGAVFITADKIESFDTNEWLQDRKKKWSTEFS